VHTVKSAKTSGSGRSAEKAPRSGSSAKAKTKTTTKPSKSGKAAATKRTGKAAATRAAPSRALESPTREVDVRRVDESRASALAAMEAALDKKALLPVLIDVSRQGTYTDFIGIVSARSERQVEAIAENVIDALEARGLRLLGREGSGNGRWVLLDFADVVLHVFHHPVREVYDLESLWIEAPRVPFDVPPEATHFPPDALYESL
jgi:ribosome-associated protein